MATSTGALPKPATQWTAIHGNLLSIFSAAVDPGDPCTLFEPFICAELTLRSALDVGGIGQSLKRSMINSNHWSIIFCGGGVPIIHSWLDHF